MARHLSATLVCDADPRPNLNQRADHLKVVCATGFDVSHRPRYPMIGQNNVDLREKWVEDPESYISVMTPDFPNYFMVRHFSRQAT